jgi:hypothetical protein
MATILPFILFLKWEKTSPYKNSPLSAKFPWWGWCGIVLELFFWILAWSRFPWFALLQPYTFTPLWLSYIFIINALSYHRTSRCLLINQSGFFMMLFPASAVFWWFFEYLNRFVQNWYYVGVAFSPWEYFWYATLPFSTVLPAVWSTKQWIDSWLHLENPYANSFQPDRIQRDKSRYHRFSLAILILSGAGLMGIGIFPDYLFPLLWVSPLLIIVSLQTLLGESNVLVEAACGQWQRIVSSALAALMCGFFWELWNFYSLAKWEYCIPFVQRYQIFEMPLLGYTGYLPFGLECIVIGQMVQKVKCLTEPVGFD